MVIDLQLSWLNIISPDSLQNAEELQPPYRKNSTETYRMTNWVKFPSSSGICPVSSGFPNIVLHVDKATMNKHFVFKSNWEQLAY